MLSKSFQNILKTSLILSYNTEKAMAPHSSTLAWKIHGWRSLVGCSPWGCEQSDTTERLHFSFSLSCIGEGNGNPLQCSCLENPRDGGAWWGAIYGVAQSQTRLKRLSSSSSSLAHRLCTSALQCCCQEAYSGFLPYSLIFAVFSFIYFVLFKL